MLPYTHPFFQSLVSFLKSGQLLCHIPSVASSLPALLPRSKRLLLFLNTKPLQRPFIRCYYPAVQGLLVSVGAAERCGASSPAPEKKAVKERVCPYERLPPHAGGSGLTPAMRSGSRRRRQYGEQRADGRCPRN